MTLGNPCRVENMKVLKFDAGALSLNARLGVTKRYCDVTTKRKKFFVHCRVVKRDAKMLLINRTCNKQEYLWTFLQVVFMRSRGSALHEVSQCRTITVMHPPSGYQNWIVKSNVKFSVPLVLVSTFLTTEVLCLRRVQEQLFEEVL